MFTKFALRSRVARPFGQARCVVLYVWGVSCRGGVFGSVSVARAIGQALLCLPGYAWSIFFPSEGFRLLAMQAAVGRALCCVRVGRVWPSYSQRDSKHGSVLVVVFVGRALCLFLSIEEDRLRAERSGVKIIFARVGLERALLRDALAKDVFSVGRGRLVVGPNLPHQISRKMSVLDGPASFYVHMPSWKMGWLLVCLQRFQPSAK